VARAATAGLRRWTWRLIVVIAVAGVTRPLWAPVAMFTYLWLTGWSSG